MTHLPVFTTTDAYRDRLGDVGFWRPHIDAVLRRHGLDADSDIVPGFNPTFPTFVVGDAVVKLFGYVATWQATYRAERAALAAVTAARGIAAPTLLAEGRLGDGESGWPYLVLSRVDGVAWQDADLSVEAKLALAAELGQQVKRLHALPTTGLATESDWRVPPMGEAVALSTLPRHLLGGVDDFLAGLPPPEPVFVHGDLVGTHLRVADGRLTGIIDWGDAMVADRHLELAKLHVDTFHVDKTLLAAFLKAADWPVGEDFARRTLGQTLRRHALGLAQHLSFDVFHTLSDTARRAATLDDLAEAMFGI